MTELKQSPLSTMKSVQIKRIVGVLLVFALVYMVFILRRQWHQSEPEKTIAHSHLSFQQLYSSPQNSSKGLQARDGWFWLNGNKTRLFSGAMHYFRIPREHWEDRLVKLRASGCNVVETYVPWNLHEPQSGKFNFADNLDIRSYIKLAEECGLFVIVRPGPYICSEWDLGGLPSWLLRDPEMRLRSTYKPYMKAVKKYFFQLFMEISDLQYSSSGGPIIAWQIENEYGSFGNDTEYLFQLSQLMIASGCTELFFTSDNPSGMWRGFLDGVLMTANFQRPSGGEKCLDILTRKQPNMPRMCMEFWTGWFDHWGERHHAFPLTDFEESLKFILTAYGNVNFYMFHGGTNFGFMSGANEGGRAAFPTDTTCVNYAADVTSYDYDAPVSEEGLLTDKYYKLKEMLAKCEHEVTYLGPVKVLTNILIPTSYEKSLAMSFINFTTLLTVSKLSHIEGRPVSMEMLPINNGNGQSYGWALYRKKIMMAGQLKVAGAIRDRAVIYLNGKMVTVILCHKADLEIDLPEAGTLDILVENMGRSNYQNFRENILNSQRKGLNNDVFFDERPLVDWDVYSLDFSDEFYQRLTKVAFAPGDCNLKLPAVIKFILKVYDFRPSDTFLDMNGWGKGLVMVNGRTLGRYWSYAGPTKTLYLPGPWLKSGDNEIIVFELEALPSSCILTTSKAPKLG